MTPFEPKLKNSFTGVKRYVLPTINAGNKYKKTIAVTAEQLKDDWRKYVKKLPSLYVDSEELLKKLWQEKRGKIAHKLTPVHVVLKRVPVAYKPDSDAAKRVADLEAKIAALEAAAAAVGTPVEPPVAQTPVYILATDSAVELAVANKIDLSKVKGTGVGGKIIKADVQKVV